MPTTYLSLLTTIVFVTAVVTIKRAVTALIVPHTAASRGARAVIHERTAAIC